MAASALALALYLYILVAPQLPDMLRAHPFLEHVLTATGCTSLFLTVPAVS
jgi:hypothetical protein